MTCTLLIGKSVLLSVSTAVFSKFKLSAPKKFVDSCCCFSIFELSRLSDHRFVILFVYEWQGHGDSLHRADAIFTKSIFLLDFQKHSSTAIRGACGAVQHERLVRNTAIQQQLGSVLTVHFLFIVMRTRLSIFLGSWLWNGGGAHLLS